MKDHWENTIFEYFDKKISICNQHKDMLIIDAREDEAAFEKIRANVYDIFKTIFTTAIKVSGENDTDAVKSFFLKKIGQIPQNWREARGKAEQFDDVERIQVEQIKLETAKEIQNAFEHIWEELQ